MRYVLALDQGTTSSRAILFDEKGKLVETAQREFRQIFPQPGWVEHDAKEILATQRATAREVIRRSDIPLNDLMAIGSPLCRSQTIVVSRWLVIPTPMRSFNGVFRMASRAVARCVSRISFASCSTQPGCGKIWRNSRCATDTGRPCSSNRIARELVVP